MGVEAVKQRHDDVLIELLTRPRWNDPGTLNKSTSAAHTLNIHRVIDDTIINRLPRWKNNNPDWKDTSTWKYAASHLLKEVLSEFFSDQGVDTVSYEAICEDVEYRTGLVQVRRETNNLMSNAGEFLLENRWEHVGDSWDNDATRAERRFAKT